MTPRVLTSMILLAGLHGCATQPPQPLPSGADESPTLAEYPVDHEVVREAFVTASTPIDNIDSPASWRAPDGSTWLFATAKQGGGLMIYDGDTGATLRKIGQEGSAPGEFRRPNGIAVVGDLMFVVERDNHRVQLLQLPSLDTLTTFGEAQLTLPYGLWVQPLSATEYEVTVTDAYMAGKRPNGWDLPPPLPQLDRRMQRFGVTVDAGKATATHLRSFGDTTEQGAIRVPESIAGDVVHDRLLIAEEDTLLGTAVREYSLDGRYRRTHGLGTFRAQAEGIALWQCDDGSGYWLTTDQFHDLSVFHVYDRESLKHLGAFSGERVGNTDGIWLNQAGSKRFPQGVFYAVHDDQGVGAFDWRDIANTLKLRASCDERH
jgi:3-phytase